MAVLHSKRLPKSNQKKRVAVYCKQLHKSNKKKMVTVSSKELHDFLCALKQAAESGIYKTQAPTTSTSIFSSKELHDFLCALKQAAESIQTQTQQNQQNGDQGTGHSDEPRAKPVESDWVISIKDNLDKAQKDDEACCWDKLCIYRIPQCLRDVGDDKAYIPQIVSLGPYHHNETGLRNMDRHKWRALNNILKRTNQEIQLYLDAVKKLEEKTRACYEGSFSLNSNEFVEMIVLDSCFVLELFRGAADEFTKFGYSSNDPIFAMRAPMHLIQRDMMKLENQIPLFILDRLFELQSLNPNGEVARLALEGEVARLALEFFHQLKPMDEPLTKINPSKLELPQNHCLEVFRRNLLEIQTDPKPAPQKVIKQSSHADCVADKRRHQLIHCVTELKDYGIKFKKMKTDRFWDIKFKNGVLQVPRLLIHDGTKSLFLNLIAYEQCHLDCTNEITSYVIFMDNLIDSPEDVSYLHHCGIIEHWLGSDAEVADLFNRLCQEVVFDKNDSYLSNLSEEVNHYCDRRWNAWRASLKHTYFNNPWSTISVIAAVILLLLTLAQTFYTVYGFYRPHV